MPDWFNRLKEENRILTTAESCTGGLIAAAITDIPGSSAIFDRGFVTYSNEAKRDLLGVSPETLTTYGAVSPQTAKEMAAGALSRSNATIAVSCTGIAGPDGGTPEKPVGLVYIGIAVKNKPAQSHEHRFTGDRTAIRRQTVDAALQYITKEPA